MPPCAFTGGNHASAFASCPRHASSQLYGSVVLPTSVLGGSLEVTLAQARYVLASVVIGLALGDLYLAKLHQGVGVVLVDLHRFVQGSLRGF